MALDWTFADRMFQSNTGPSFPRISYLIAGNRTSTSAIPTISKRATSRGAAIRRRRPTVSRAGSERRRVAGTVPVLQTSGRSPTNSMPPICRGVTTRPRFTVLGNIWSVLRCDSAHPLRTGLEQRHLARNAASSPIRARAILPADDLGRADGRAIPIIRFRAFDRPGHGSRGTIWPGMGRRRSSMRSARARFGIARRSSSCGTIGAASTITSRRRSSTTMGLGGRVPFIVISPYARQHYVSHVQHEFGSILKFSENVFGLPRLGRPTFAPTACGTASTSTPRRVRSYPFASRMRAKHNSTCCTVPSTTSRPTPTTSVPVEGRCRL